MRLISLGASLHHRLDRRAAGVIMRWKPAVPTLAAVTVKVHLARGLNPTRLVGAQWLILSFRTAKG